jgi:hypothetical protein
MGTLRGKRHRSHNESLIADQNRHPPVDSVLTPASGAPANGEFALADATDKLDTLTAPWKCATLKATLGRFVDGKVPRGPHNFLAYQGRRMRRRRGRG